MDVMRVGRVLASIRGGLRHVLSEYDILFWLLIAVLAVLAYAVESGIASQNRHLVFTTMLSVTVSAVYIMFLVEDKSSLEFERPAPPNQTEGEGGAELGVMPFGEKQKGGGASGSAAGGGGQPAGPADKAKTSQGPFTDCDVCPSMIFVEGGRFSMGSPLTERGRTAAHEERRAMTIAKDYAIGRFEIMRDEFAAFVTETRHPAARGCLVDGKRASSASWLNPGFEQGGRHPVVCVSHGDAKAYVAWLGKKSGKKYRLPSEAEWEYAARAGSADAYYMGPNIGASHGNFGRVREGTTPVGYFGSNLSGVFDVHGNVWEIMDDCWNADLSFLPQDGRALGLLGNCEYRALRGGGWDSPATDVRSAMRASAGSAAISNTVGFRVARSID